MILGMYIGLFVTSGILMIGRIVKLFKKKNK